MTNSHLTLILNDGPEITTQDLEELARGLRAELLEQDVETIKPAERKAPAGSKTSTTIDWTTLFVTLATSGALTAIIAAIQAWLLRNQGNSVTVKIGDDELIIAGVGPYSEEQKQTITQWLNRHKGFLLPNE